MLRSGHFDYSSRWTALSILLADPLFAEPVEAEIVSAIAEPGVPLARNGWDALSQATRPGIARSLIDRLVPGDDERSLGLAFGLATMIGRVELSRDDVFRLRPRLRLLVDDGSAAEQEMGYMLAGRLGPTTMSNSVTRRRRCGPGAATSKSRLTTSSTSTPFGAPRASNTTR